MILSRKQFLQITFLAPYHTDPVVRKCKLNARFNTAKFVFRMKSGLKCSVWLLKQAAIIFLYCIGLVVPMAAYCVVFSVKYAE